MIVHSLTEASWEVVISVCSSSQARLLTWWSRCASGEKEGVLRGSPSAPPTPHATSRAQAVPTATTAENLTPSLFTEGRASATWKVAAGNLKPASLRSLPDTGAVLTTNNVPWESELLLPQGGKSLFLFMHKATIQTIHKQLPGVSAVIKWAGGGGSE